MLTHDLCKGISIAFATFLLHINLVDGILELLHVPRLVKQFLSAITSARTELSDGQWLRSRVMSCFVVVTIISHRKLGLE